jgi:hypothetical protein
VQSLAHFHLPQSIVPPTGIRSKVNRWRIIRSAVSSPSGRKVAIRPDRCARLLSRATTQRPSPAAGFPGAADRVHRQNSADSGVAPFVVGRTVVTDDEGSQACSERSLLGRATCAALCAVLSTPPQPVDRITYSVRRAHHSHPTETPQPKSPSGARGRRNHPADHLSEKTSITTSVAAVLINASKMGEPIADILVVRPCCATTSRNALSLGLSRAITASSRTCCAAGVRTGYREARRHVPARTRSQWSVTTRRYDTSRSAVGWSLVVNFGARRTPIDTCL